MRRHFGATIAVGLLASGASIWWVNRTWGQGPIYAAFLLFIVVGMPLSLISAGHRSGALPSPWTVVFGWAAAGSLLWVTARLDARWYVKVLLVAVVAGPLMSITNALHRRDGRRAQALLDEASADVVRRVRAGEPVDPVSLYLRPFVSTERLIAQPVSELGSSEFPVHLDAETLLARALRTDRPLVALGRPREIGSGAGRVALGENEWRDVVWSVARQSSLIVMVPLARAGTLEELRFLAEQDLLAKTVFLMPEAVGGPASGVVVTTESDVVFDDVGIRRYRGEEHDLDLPVEWTAAREAAQQLGVELPLQAGVGALFTLDPESRSLARIAPLGLSSLSRRHAYLADAICWLGDPSASTAALIRILEAASFWRGRTFEYVLVRAADGYVVWGDLEAARQLLHRACEEGRNRPRVTTYFLNGLSEFVAQAREQGDAVESQRYTEAARLLWADERLAPLVQDEARSRLA